MFSRRSGQPLEIGAVRCGARRGVPEGTTAVFTERYIEFFNSVRRGAGADGTVIVCECVIVVQTQHGVVKGDGVSVSVSDL